MNYVIFDMDGVIADSEPVIMKAALTSLRSGGISATYEDFKEFIGAGEENFIISPCKRAGREDMIEPLTERMLSEFEKSAADIKVFPSAKPLIEELKKLGKTLALVSSSARRKLNASLKSAKIAPDIFDVILSGSDVTEKKPSPRPYLAAAERLGAKPKDCLVIEDAINGILSAKSAGMKCVAVTTSFKKEELIAANPDFITDDLIDVIDIIQKI